MAKITEPVETMAEEKGTYVNVMCRGELRPVKVSQEQLDELQIKQFEKQIAMIKQGGEHAEFIALMLDKGALDIYLTPVKGRIKDADQLRRIAAIEKFVADKDS